MPDLVLHRRAQRYARRLPADLKEKVKKSLAKLAEDPDTYPGAKIMVGQWQGCRRIRIGNLRVIYSYQAEESIIYLIISAHAARSTNASDGLSRKHFKGSNSNQGTDQTLLN